MNELRRVPWATLPLDERQHLATNLTSRQYHCYALWLIGCSYQTIAGYLGISVRTVRMHIDRAKAIHAQFQKEAA